MCLITEQKQPLIAEEDIIVYKAMESRLRSYFQRFQYTLNELFETKIKPINSNYSWVCCCRIDRDYLYEKYNVHSIESLESNPDLICLEKGFSSCESQELAQKLLNTDYGGCVYECTIPKGSEYHKDGVGFIISNKIIINRKIE